MKALTPSEHKALASLAPTREVYGKPPLPIEILAAGGPRALARFGRNPDSGLHKPKSARANQRPKALREWLRKGKA